MTDRDTPAAFRNASPLLAAVMLIAGTLARALFAQAVLESEALAAAYVSRPVWISLVQALGGTLPPFTESLLVVSLPIATVLARSARKT